MSREFLRERTHRTNVTARLELDFLFCPAIFPTGLNAISACKVSPLGRRIGSQLGRCSGEVCKLRDEGPKRNPHATIAGIETSSNLELQDGMKGYSWMERRLNRSYRNG